MAEDYERDLAWQACGCCDNQTGAHEHDDATCQHICCPGWDEEE